MVGLGTRTLCGPACSGLTGVSPSRGRGPLCSSAQGAPAARLLDGQSSLCPRDNSSSPCETPQRLPLAYTCGPGAGEEPEVPGGPREEWGSRLEARALPSAAGVQGRLSPRRQGGEGVGVSVPPGGGRLSPALWRAGCRLDTLSCPRARCLPLPPAGPLTCPASAAGPQPIPSDGCVAPAAQPRDVSVCRRPSPTPAQGPRGQRAIPHEGSFSRWGGGAGHLLGSLPSVGSRLGNWPRN